MSDKIYGVILLCICTLSLYFAIIQPLTVVFFAVPFGIIVLILGSCIDNSQMIAKEEEE